MARGGIRAMFEQYLHCLCFSANHHPDQRRLPVLRFGLPRKTFRERALQRPGVARQNFGNAIEPAVIQLTDRIRVSQEARHAQHRRTERLPPSDVLRDWTCDRRAWWGDSKGTDWA